MAGELNLGIKSSIKKRAESYTPEWRFDIENPDIGSALALAFAEMVTGTAKRFAGIPMKNRIAFLNALHVSLLPAVPARGYVQFSLINEEAEGTGVEAGTVVVASDMQEGQIFFETQEDVYVTPAGISDIYQTSDRCDTIFELYDRQKKEWSPVSLFSSEGVNLQGHELYVSHSNVLAIHSEAYIEIACYGQGGIPFGPDRWAILADRERAVFEYYSEQGWMPFESQRITENGMEFHKDKAQPEFVKMEMEGSGDYWIRCRILDFFACSNMYFEKLALSSRNKEMLPDTIWGAMEECDRYQCFPFGERLDLYQEVYFGSEEVLSKKGAQITFSFGIQFVKVPLDSGDKEAFQWEWVMKQSDFRQETEYDITIESVVWEYYNGSGWTKLFAEGRDNQNGRIFSDAGRPDGSYRTLQFICPADIERTLVNATETYYIRARINKMNNLYKLTGNFVVPRIENISFRYRYEKVGPERYLFHNNLEKHCFTGRALKEKDLFLPFYQTGMEETGIYLGFEVPPAGSPVRMLFCIAEEKDRSGQRFFWECWDGQKWRTVNLVDGTDYFSRTGLITFTDNMELERRVLFGKERYWLRIRASGRSSGIPAGELLLEKICMNTTSARNISRREREYFQMEVYQEDKSFALLEENIFDMEVYVNEQGHLPEGEMQHLEKENAVFTEIDESGMQEKVWVKWQQVPDFSDSGSTDRHFVMDAAEGILSFGDGKHGRIPYPSSDENILVKYCSGGGAYTNLPAKKINKMDVSIGYISEVTNPLAMTGGCDMETPVEAVRRASAAIRHQGLAVTVRDYEDLAMCASRDIQMVKCFAGYDDRGMPLNGAVTLVVLQKQFRQGKMQFTALKETILQYMKSRISTVLLDNHRFFIVQPRLIEIRLRLELRVENYGKAFQVKKEVLRKMEQFFAPETEPGWKIGQFPDMMQIQNAINGIHDIVCIDKITMSAYTASAGEKSEVDIEAVKADRYVLPVNGKHEIMIFA